MKKSVLFLMMAALVCAPALALAFGNDHCYNCPPAIPDNGSAEAQAFVNQTAEYSQGVQNVNLTDDGVTVKCNEYAEVDLHTYGSIHNDAGTLFFGDLQARIETGREFTFSDWAQKVDAQAMTSSVAMNADAGASADVKGSGQVELAQGYGTQTVDQFNSGSLNIPTGYFSGVSSQGSQSYIGTTTVDTKSSAGK